MEAIAINAAAKIPDFINISLSRPKSLGQGHLK